MVVNFLANEEPSSDITQQHPQQSARKKKYLVAHSKEQKNSIFDYVCVASHAMIYDGDAPLILLLRHRHLSTTLLRKVRFGQPIELAIQNPSTGPNTKSKSAAIDTCPSTQSSSASQAPHEWSKASRKVHSKVFSRSQILPPRLGMLQLAAKEDSCISYNRVVRFQASDGGFLLVESDGCLRKVPKESESDPRTLVTLFSYDPHANIGKKPKRIRSGDWMFLVQGNSAALATEIGATQADSDEMIDGPRHLVKEVRRHDATAAKNTGTLRTEPQNSSAPSPLAALGKQMIRKKQLDRAFTPDNESMPTTVWCLAKVPDATNDNESQSPTETADYDDDVYFQNGAQCHLFQNHYVVCYEMESLKGNGIAGSLVTSASQMLPTSTRLNSRPSSPAMQSQEAGIKLSSRSSASEAMSPTRSSNSLFAHVWLQEVPQPMFSYHPVNCQCCSSRSCNTGGATTRRLLWDNTWRICDVDAKERDRRGSRPRPHASSRRSQQSSTYQPPSPPSQRAIGSSDERKEEQDSPHTENDDSGDHDSKHLTSETLHHRVSVPDVVKFSVKAEMQQARAARIIVRFFRRLFQDEMAQSRVQDFLRRRRRGSHRRNQFVDSDPTGKDQLKLLQCYNPHVYGPRQRSQQHGNSAPQRPRRGISFHNFISSEEVDRQMLSTMKCGVEYLNREWLQTEKHFIHKTTMPNPHEIYSRRPLSSPITSKRILMNREREHQFVIEMKMAKRDLPSFRYGSAQGARPHTAPFAAITSEAFSNKIE